MNLKLLTIGTAVAISAAMAQNATQPAAEQAAAPAAEQPAAEQAAAPAAEQPAAEQAAPAEEAAPAEQPAEQVAAPAPEPEPAPAPAPAAEPAAEPAAPEAATAEAAAPGRFDVLHGNSYNAVGNEAAAATIGGNMAIPVDMFGSKLVYVEPTLQTGAVAFGNEGTTYFLGFDNSAALGLLTAGFAKQSFGVSINASLGKIYTSTDNDAEDETYTTQPGDDIGLKAGFILGGYKLSASADWLTIREEKDQENKGGEYDEDFFDIAANLNLSNAPSGKNWFWSLGLDFLRHNLTTTTKPEKGKEVTETDPESNLTFKPYFNIGGTILSVENARVLIGLNTNVPVIIYDDIENEREGALEVGLNTTPNILAELALTNCWIIHAGVGHTWTLFDYATVEQNKTETSTITFHTNKTTVDTGIRFQYNNYALEANIAKNFYNDPLGGFNGDAMIASLGGFIFF